MITYLKYIEIRDKILNQNPKDCRVKRCFGCNRILRFLDFFNENYQNDTIEKLEKIWESPYIELYCCSCIEINFTQTKSLRAVKKPY